MSGNSLSGNSVSANKISITKQVMPINYSYMFAYINHSTDLYKRDKPPTFNKKNYWIF